MLTAPLTVAKCAHYPLCGSIEAVPARGGGVRPSHLPSAFRLREPRLPTSPYGSSKLMPEIMLRGAGSTLA